MDFVWCILLGRGEMFQYQKKQFFFEVTEFGGKRRDWALYPIRTCVEFCLWVIVIHLLNIPGMEYSLDGGEA